MKPKIVKDEISGQEQKAILLRVQTWSRRIIDLDDTIEGGGSGTAIRVKHQRFIATAAHVIRPDHRYAVSAKPGSRQMTRILKKSMDCHSDVGLLEVEPLQGDDQQFADLREITKDYDHDGKCDVVLAGFPGALLKKLQPKGFAATASLVSTETVPPADWPVDWPASDDGEKRPLSTSMDMLLLYPNNFKHQSLSKDQHLATTRCTDHTATEPGGFSGGGIWLNKLSVLPQSALIVPSPRLIGIQTAFFRRRRLLRGTQIAYWVELLSREYPKLGIYWALPGA